MSEKFLHQKNNLDKAMIPVTKPHATSLSIAALVLGIVAILGSWIPFINLISIVIGILAIIFGIICLVNANRDHIGKDFPLIGIVLGSLTILISPFITLGTLYFINTIEPELNPPSSYKSKIDDLPNNQFEDMTNEAFLTAFQKLADDYEKLVEDFQKNPSDETISNKITDLSERWGDFMTYFYDNEDDFSDDDYQQVLEIEKRLMIASRIFIRESTINSSYTKPIGV
ncbi:MAG: DUF4190 domain-containing protein [Pseudolactococcus laudensis]|uniref:DUF4190 domain-containing protein n=1 Tax=Pseudolactococcus laudensis TaxID=1494461 RepID=UPI003F9CD683